MECKTDSGRPSDETTAEYRILVDLLMHQHTRYSAFCNMSLVIHTAWMALIGLAWKEFQDDPDLATPLALVGIGFCVLWFCALRRLRLDDKRLLWQLRAREARLDAGSIYLEGDRFYNQKKPLRRTAPERPGGMDELAFPKWFFFPSRFRANWVGQGWAILFVLLYLAIIVSIS